MDWSKLIKELMDAGMTQGEIAKLCGVSAPRISVLMKGGSTVTYEVGVKLLALRELKVAA